MFLYFLLALRPFIYFCVLRTFTYLSVYIFDVPYVPSRENMKYETTQNQPRKAGIYKSVVD